MAAEAGGFAVIEDGGRWRRVQWAAIVLCGLVWIGSGITKLVDVDGFRSVVRDHAILPETLQGLLNPLGAVEIGLGLAVLVLGGHPGRAGLRRGVAFVSGLLLVGLTVYLISIPSERLERSGCGCHGGTQLVKVLGASVRAFGLSVNSLMFLCHVAVWLPLRRDTGVSGVALAE